MAYRIKMKQQILNLIPQGEASTRKRVENCDDNPQKLLRILASTFGYNKDLWDPWQYEVETLFAGIALLDTEENGEIISPDTETWLLGSIGKTYDGDGAHGAQCKDYANAYSQWLGHPLQPSDAAEAWAIKQDSFWVKVPYKTGEKPNQGDIVVWDSWKQNSYGHIAVVLDASEDSFRSVDQNWKDSNLETGSEASIITHNYTDPKILGYLRPNFGQ